VTSTGFAAPESRDRPGALTEAGWIRLAGWAGIGTVILDVVAMVLNFAPGVPPDYTDAARFAAYVHNGGPLLIGAGLLFTLSFTIGMAFVVGIRDLIASGGGAWRSVSNLFLVANAVAYAVGYVGIGLLIASVTEATTKGDPAVVRALFGGGFSTLGAVNYAELAFAVAVYGFAVRRLAFLPRWTGWLAWIAAVGSAASMPAAFGGSGFYSQLGPAPLMIGFLPLLAWSLAVAICMVRRVPGAEVA
jgi:hypothetical protein